MQVYKCCLTVRRRLNFRFANAERITQRMPWTWKWSTILILLVWPLARNSDSLHAWETDLALSSRRITNVASNLRSSTKHFNGQLLIYLLFNMYFVLEAHNKNIFPIVYCCQCFWQRLGDTLKYFDGLCYSDRNVENDSVELQPGDEVEFQVPNSSAKIPAAERIRKLKSGTIVVEVQFPSVIFLLTNA